MVCFAVFVLMFCALFCIAAGGDDGAEAELYLEAESECGQITVVLRLSSEGGICGLLAEIGYDDELLVFLGCGLHTDNSGEENGGGEMSISESRASELKISYYEYDGKVRFLLDGVTNSERECALAEFYFGIREGAVGGIAFNLSAVGEDYVLTLREDGKLRAVSAKLLSCTLSLASDEVKEEKPMLPILCRSMLYRRGDGAVLSLSAEIFDGSCFAMGFKLFIISFDGAGAQGVTFSRVISRACEEKNIRQEITIEQQSALSIVITPLAYHRGGYIEGEKTVIFIGENKNSGSY